uniref:ribosomal protein L5 n=1 Tax=Sporochnus bolleanus TaxID=461143 RepID=UPI002E762CFF|nr:ribosomal protein L5 [Sporochnus bolleanus]WBP70333.1 ribosomal protein L5 [Sporochnus bolleanus]
MHPFQKHYYEVVQRDLILSENTSTVATLPGPKKITLCLGGDSSDDSYVLSSLAALNIITGQKPLLTQQKLNQHRNSGFRNPFGGKLVLRRSVMYTFWYKLLFNVLPCIRQFEGLRAPAHENIYCFLLKDMFAFEELVPLFPYFEALGSLRCHFYFTTKNKSEVVAVGHGLQLCFLPAEK